MLTARRSLFQCVRRSSSSTKQDHYQTLGVGRDASLKEIKSAFYDISKKYHPDANPEGGEKAAEQFQKAVSAYEVLSSEEKKRAYDASLRPRGARRMPMQHGHHPSTTATTYRRKDYTDLDIEYKDFEHFQRSTRRRQAQHDHFQMPDEFFAKFGGRSFKSRLNDSDFIPRSSNYKDTLAYKREMEELRIQREIEEQRKKEKHPLPTFEQLIQQEEARKRAQAAKTNTFAFAIGTAGLCILAGLALRP
ncbi:Protein DNJ-18 [Aphelenchoides avenae]|nr:Protein DNJ-18 [Aphelenchus avenae]